jgi:hypothetical protein
MDYAVFGGRLRSSIRFPELREHDGDGPFDWSLEIADSTPEMSGAVQLGEHVISKDVSARLYSHASGFRLAYDDTGVFEVSADGRRIRWTPVPGASEESARLDVIGFVLALALHAAGVYALHGSAIATAKGVAAFIAPRGHGKSTLAMALVASGARLGTDDSLAVTPTSRGVMAAPGIQSVRLRNDSFGRLSSGQGIDHGLSNGKRLLRLGQEQAIGRAAPLEAIYLLGPVVSDPAREAVRRAQLAPGVSALVLAGHAKLASLLHGTQEAGVLLERAASVARGVPVFSLELARDMDRLPEVVERVLEWHPLGAA